MEDLKKERDLHCRIASWGMSVTMLIKFRGMHERTS